MHKSIQIAKACEKVANSGSDEKRLKALVYISVWLDQPVKEIEKNETWVLDKLEALLK